MKHPKYIARCQRCDNLSIHGLHIADYKYDMIAPVVRIGHAERWILDVVPGIIQGTLLMYTSSFLLIAISPAGSSRYKEELRLLN